MKKILTLVIAIVMLSGLTMAQNSVNAGSKSLNFTFAGLGAFGLNGTGPSGGLGISYFMTQDAALRLGLQIGLTSKTTPAAATGNTDATESTFDFGIGADYLMYMSGATSKVRPYVGLGVGVGIASSDKKPSVANNPANGTVVEQTNGRGGVDGFKLNVAGILGGEFFLYPELSLSAEYQLGLLGLLSPADQVQKVQGQADATAKGQSVTNILGFGAAGATLHIYF
ncbi:MAG: outer membrane beta-barrel protein [Bacteroidota bacterium]|nr:outer membrane beta-barrel protein [Bacteroidota bacterium]